MSEAAHFALYISLGSLFLLMLLGVPLCWVLLCSGLIGFAIMGELANGFQIVAIQAWTMRTNDIMYCGPLYLLMGQLAYESGLISTLFDFAKSLVGKTKGGLPMAVVVACAFLGAMSGSSTTALATLTPVAIPELYRNGYNKVFAASTIAGSATLAVMLPPSLPLITYGWLTDTSIAKLFMAGIVPGVITTIIYGITLSITLWLRPSYIENQKMAAPDREYSWHHRGRLAVINGPMIVVMLLVLGGIYLGWFTPTESAAIGTFLVVLLAVFSKKLSFKIFFNTVFTGGKVISLLVFILIGAMTFGNFISISGATREITNWIVSLHLSNFFLLSVLFLMYLVLGMFIDAFSMTVLTIPVVCPIVVAAGIDIIWFAIFVVFAVQLAAMTPPLGYNVYYVVTMSRDEDLTADRVFAALVPIMIATTIVTLLVVLIPQIVLWLPNTMM